MVATVIDCALTDLLWPNLSPPHIHFIVTVEGYDVLETQWIGDERQKAIDFTMVLEPK